MVSVCNIFGRYQKLSPYQSIGYRSSQLVGGLHIAKQLFLPSLENSSLWRLERLHGHRRRYMQRLSRILRFIAFGFALFSASSLFGQTLATVQGQVSDPSGAV